MNDELIQERLHSQHLLTKLHSHEVTAKNSRLLGLVEKLDIVAPPVEEAITPTTLVRGLLFFFWMGGVGKYTGGVINFLIYEMSCLRKLLTLPHS